MFGCFPVSFGCFGVLGKPCLPTLIESTYTPYNTSSNVERILLLTAIADLETNLPNDSVDRCHHSMLLLLENLRNLITMTAINDSRLWLPLLVLLASGLLSVVHPAEPSEEEILKASIVYRKKPGTADVIKCSETMDCFMQKDYCAAFYMGDNFYVTGAHCLVAKDGFVLGSC